MSSTTESSFFTLQDGAKLGYDIFGSEHLGNNKTLPLILIGGLSSLKIDWDRLIYPLSQCRTVMTFDHRGIGDSTYSTAAQNDNITIEIMARDLLAIIEHLGWKDVDILGFSMGGVILQQLLLLPVHPLRPTPLTFRVHHALLTATMCSPLLPETSPPQSDSGSLRPGRQLTTEEKKELARPMLDASLGPQWVAQAENRERYDRWLERAIVKDLYAPSLRDFDFRQQLGRIPTSIKVLLIHGEDDLVVPFSAGLRMLELIPHATVVARGTLEGQVPSYKFGHLWYEYFEVEVWKHVIEGFADDKYVASEKVRL